MDITGFCEELSLALERSVAADDCLSEFDSLEMLIAAVALEELGATVDVDALTDLVVGGANVAELHAMWVGARASMLTDRVFASGIVERSN